ncbi:MAG: Toxic anion resistance family protein, partial [Halothiobacillaceae bacterium]
MGKSKPAVKLLQQYEQVRQQIDTVTIKLERHKTKLLTDIALLDRLYRASLDYFHQLELYITAGDKKLHQLDSELIPQQEQQSQRSGALLSAQELRDLRGVRDELERRVHDLRLTRQVALQSLPSIRLVQENDKGLVNKISSTIVNTVPLWRQQLATAVTLQRTREAAATVKSATDLTNQLLEANAAALKHSNREARTEMERGLFDIESIKRANQMLIETIEESLRLADEGKLRRSQAVAELESCESRLKQSLIAA